MSQRLEAGALTGVARQPILTADGKVYGYELLCRARTGDRAWAGSAEHASARVFDDAVLSIGLSALTSGRTAFVNVAHQTLVSGAATVLPSSGVVLELVEDIPANSETMAAVRSLRDLGYAIALDDFVPNSPAEEFLPFAKYVKVDVLATPAGDAAQLALRLLPSGVRLLAEKVETQETFLSVRDSGYSLFQGYYFCRPATVAVRTLAANTALQMQLIAALNQPNVTLQTIEELLKRDPRLSFRVLRSVNSAAFGLRREVRSIGDAVLLLGLDLIRKWASIWALAGMNGGSPELVTITIVRARACELAGKAMQRPDDGAEFFLLGLCSLLDVILGLPMAAVVAELPLGSDARGALLGELTPARRVLDAIVCYERGNWPGSAANAAEAGLSDNDICTAYEAALSWAGQVGDAAA